MIEHYTLSAILHNKDAYVWAVQNIKPTYFTTNAYRYLYALIVSSYKEQEPLTQIIFAEHGKLQGLDEGEANSIYFAYKTSEDEWQPNLQLFVDQALERKSRSDIEILDSIRDSSGATQMYERMQDMINAHHTGGRKPYYSAKEIDEMPDAFTDPIVTGVHELDHELFSAGGNFKGQMMGVLAREKHGKTRFMCWKLGHELRSRHTILYIALEGRKQEIRNKILSMMGEEEYMRHRERLFIVDGIREWKDIERTIIYAIHADKVDAVYFDYLQLAHHGRLSKFDRYDAVTQDLQHLMIKFNIQITIASQLRKKTAQDDDFGEESSYKYFPTAGDMYGTAELIKASSLIVSLFRPKFYADLMMGEKSIKGIDGMAQNKETVYVTPLLSREDNHYVGNFLRLTDTSSGYRIGGWQYKQTNDGDF